MQTRALSYTTLSRLWSAANPESGTSGYAYYASGDLRTRTDARNVVSSFTYDALHRMKTKAYSDGTPTVTYEYYLTSSGSSPNIGQLNSVSTTGLASSVYNLYDNLGHVKTSTHSVSGLTGSYAFGYQWWLNDGLKEIDYPSGRVVKYDVDDAGRVKKVYGTSPSNWTYVDMTATGITNPYAADGRLAQMQLGNGLYETREYHTPGTTTLYKLGTSAAGSQRLKLEYNFHATENQWESHQPGDH